MASLQRERRSPWIMHKAAGLSVRAMFAMFAIHEVQGTMQDFGPRRCRRISPNPSLELPPAQSNRIPRKPNTSIHENVVGETCSP